MSESYVNSKNITSQDISEYFIPISDIDFLSDRNIYTYKAETTDRAKKEIGTDLPDFVSVRSYGYKLDDKDREMLNMREKMHRFPFSIKYYGCMETPQFPLKFHIITEDIYGLVLTDNPTDIVELLPGRQSKIMACYKILLLVSLLHYHGIYYGNLETIDFIIDKDIKLYDIGNSCHMATNMGNCDKISFIDEHEKKYKYYYLDVFFSIWVCSLILSNLKKCKHKLPLVDIYLTIKAMIVKLEKYNTDHITLKQKVKHVDKIFNFTLRYLASQLTIPDHDIEIITDRYIKIPDLVRSIKKIRKITQKIRTTESASKINKIMKKLI
jgi:hypothetical protein